MKLSLTLLLSLKLLGDVYCLNNNYKSSNNTQNNCENTLDKNVTSTHHGLLNKNGVCPSFKTSHILLSRKKRTLSFPDNTAFVITISLVKAILIGLPLGWNQALEMDVFYPAPGLLELRRYKYPHLKKLAHRQRRDVWGSFEAILDASGVNGQACILRTICEAQKYLAPVNKSLVHDLLRTLFLAPEVGESRDIYSSASSLEDCRVSQVKEKDCPFSLLELLLSYDKV